MLPAGQVLLAVYKLDHADYIILEIAHGYHQHGTGDVVMLLIKGRIVDQAQRAHILQLIHICDIEHLSRDSHIAGNRILVHGHDKFIKRDIT
jgi:hypothetical protein